MTSHPPSPAFPAGCAQYACPGEPLATAEIDGFTLTFQIDPEDSGEAPWQRDDAHGPVSDWTSRGKRAGEVLLCQAHAHRRFYDLAAATRQARTEGWQPRNPASSLTPRALAAAAAREDFETLRAWCEDRWYYAGVVVTASRQGRELGCAALWGIEIGHPADPNNTYAESVAADLIPGTLADARAFLAAVCPASIAAD